MSIHNPPTDKATVKGGIHQLPLPLFITTTGSNQRVYIYRVHSQVLSMHRNQTGLLLVFETVKEEDVGNYVCTATGMDGHGHSISIKLTVTSEFLRFDLVVVFRQSITTEAAALASTRQVWVDVYVPYVHITYTISIHVYRDPLTPRVFYTVDRTPHTA